MSGETTCGAACIIGTSCAYAVTADPASAANVWTNGSTFVKFALASASSIVGANVADAVVAVQVADPTHVWIEVPPGVLGPADVTLKTGSGSVVTKRALLYIAASEGTTWTTKQMSVARGGFPAMATTFDGRALVAGGYFAPVVADCTDTADLFDRQTSSSTMPSNNMSTKRWTATATTALTGKTVIAGACDQITPVGVCESFDSQVIDLFDPTTNAFAPATARLSIPRSFLRNLRLADGRILLTSAETPPFEIYDPVADTSTPVTAATAVSDAGFAVPTSGLLARLRDGRVLVVPGDSVPNTLFDPVANTFTPTGDSLPQRPDALVTVGDGRVFAIGGVLFSASDAGEEGTTTNAISVYDPAVGHFAPFSMTLATSRSGSTSVLARDGAIYVIGGLSGTIPIGTACGSAAAAGLALLDSVEVIDPTAGVTPGPPLPNADESLRSTILFDGSLIAGGGTPCGPTAQSYPFVYFLEAPAIQ